MKDHSPARRVVHAWAIVAMLAGCGSSSRTSDSTLADDPKTPCSNLADAYARCQSKMNVPQGGAERAAAMRSSLTAHVMAAKTDEERLKVSGECESGLKQLRAVCP